jgi:hypothetical protein
VGDPIPLSEEKTFPTSSLGEYGTFLGDTGAGGSLLALIQPTGTSVPEPAVAETPVSVLHAHAVAGSSDSVLHAPPTVAGTSVPVLHASQEASASTATLVVGMTEPSMDLDSMEDFGQSALATSTAPGTSVPVVHVRIDGSAATPQGGPARHVLRATPGEGVPLGAPLPSFVVRRVPPDLKVPPGTTVTEVPATASGTCKTETEVSATVGGETCKTGTEVPATVGGACKTESEDPATA